MAGERHGPGMLCVNQPYHVYTNTICDVSGVFEHDECADSEESWLSRCRVDLQ